MKKQVLKITLIDIAALILWCLIAKFTANLQNSFQQEYLYGGELFVVSLKVLQILVIPVAYVAINRITGADNDFLFMWNIPILAVLAALMMTFARSIVPITPDYFGIFIFAASCGISHMLIRFAH